MTYLVHSDKPTAQSRADDLTLARLKEVWGDDYEGQTTWPDKVTVRAVDPFEHPSDGRAAFVVDPRHEKHYTDTEKNGKRDRPWMIDEKFLPDPAQLRTA